jgi:hypothetical protein
LAVLANSARVFLTSEHLLQNQRYHSLNKEYTERVRVTKLAKSNFRQLIVDNEINLLIATLDFLLEYRAEVKVGLSLGMQLLLLDAGKKQEQLHL